VGKIKVLANKTPQMGARSTKSSENGHATHAERPPHQFPNQLCIPNQNDLDIFVVVVPPFST
jgi:hypothetical protein